MTAAQLKASILQLAIQGKLVPQDPNDEPAEVLLARIECLRQLPQRAQRAQRGAKSSDTLRSSANFAFSASAPAGKNPVNPVKKYPPVTDDEKPFDLPANWTWSRLGEIGKWGSGATPSKSNAEYHRDGTIPWLLTGDLNDAIVTDIPNKITQKALNETSVKLNPVGSVLIAMYGATIGKVAILGVAATTNQACCACAPFECVFNKYLFYFLMSQRVAFQKRGEGGTYSELVNAIGGLLERARAKIATVANFELVKTYWETGRYIVEYEQHGADRAKYGEGLIVNLSKDLRLRYGRGYSRTNLIYMRKLYQTFRKSQTLSDLLSWSHYLEILRATSFICRTRNSFVASWREQSKRNPVVQIRRARFRTRRRSPSQRNASDGFSLLGKTEI